MRKILPIFFILLINICSAQTFNQKEIKRLNSFGISLNNFDLNDQSNYLNLESILKKDKKRRTNKTFGIVLISLGALTTTFGTLVFTNSKDDNNGIGQSIGGIIVAIGAVELGISIPLFISASKRKKERNEIIEKYK
jgi:hypothetical protein